MTRSPSVFATVLRRSCTMMIATASVANAQTTWYVDDDNCPGPGSGAMVLTAHQVSAPLYSHEISTPTLQMASSFCVTLTTRPSNLVPSSLTYTFCPTCIISGETKPIPPLLMSRVFAEDMLSLSSETSTSFDQGHRQYRLLPSAFLSKPRPRRASWTQLDNIFSANIFAVARIMRLPASTVGLNMQVLEFLMLVHTLSEFNASRPETNQCEMKQSYRI